MANISTVRRWMRKSWDSDGNLDLNDQPPSGRPVSAIHNLNRQKVDKRIQENWWISQTAKEEKLSTGLASDSDTAAIWVTGTVYLMGAMSPYVWHEEQNWKHGTDYYFYMKVRAIIFFPVLSQGMRVGYISRPGNEKILNWKVQKKKKKVQCWQCCIVLEGHYV